jgi:serine/threonine protein kinase/CheY-like chemotaxis protein/predicted ATPase
MNDQRTPVSAEEAGRILLVDDEVTNLDIMRETLASSSYRLFVARSGEDALKVARRAKPMIVLLDVVMPGIDGYETCRRLKEDPETRDAAVIFVSALNDPKDRVRGFEAGAVDFISKPVQAEEVIARVNTHLTIQRLLRRQIDAASPAALTSSHDDEATIAPTTEARAPGTSVFRTGDIVAFRFRIVRYLAKGGMGELYEAEDLELHERIALKTILSHISSDERSIVRFKREVHLARQVTHPNVCRIYDVFRHRYTAARADTHVNEVVFLAMELLHGETLADKLRRDGPFSTAKMLPLVRQMAAGLTAAHRVGVVHRDFKSHNVMLVKPTRAEEEMRVVVTDFGLAWRSAHDESTALSLEMSTANGISGTPAYMAPEQVEGGPVSPATDVYALGVVLYEMVTGVWPFVGETPLKMATKRLHEPAPSPRVHVPDLDPLWEATILRCLARRPEDRFASAGEVVSALEGVLTPAALTPTPFRVNSATRAVRRSSEAERRQLTVLVSGCEVFESDSYLELDSEDQARVLRAFQERCEEAVHQFGGTVVQCTDKGLLACFGFPVAYEDAAGRAARAGRAILDAMTLSRQQTDGADTLQLQPWIGIHTGAAIVESKAGLVSLVGEARNVAVRLEDVAVAGRIICTEASQRLFQGLFHCASLGRQKIKGVAHPVELFLLEHTPVAGSPMDALAPAELSPLTGRDQEIGLLMDRWEQAREGMGQVVLLIGEPGLGKSRLVHTMKQHVLREMTEGEVDAPVIEWRCSPYFQNTGLYPAIDFYERALAFDREEPSPARFDRLLHRLEQYDLARPETVPIWASLLSLPTPDRYPTLSLSPVRQREETFRTMLDWLHTRAARKPVLFIVEDLHWVDASTLEFLGQFLAEGLHDSILTLLTFRPEFKTPWPAVAHQTSLALTRLTRRQVGAMVRARMKAENLPNAFVDSIYERTGGVPLFVEELTKMVHESGILMQVGDDSAQTRALLAREIPASLQDLLMARLDRMEGDREVIQLAAALGREFSHELLAAVASDMDESTLLGEIDKLVQAEILYQKGRPPRCQYIFKHALLVDAAYNSLVKDKRQQFHRRIAEVLEARFPHIADAQPELVAHHFAEAGLMLQGAAYWLKAGLRSQDRSAYREEIGHLTNALTLLETLEETEERNDLELRVLSALAPAYIAVRGYAAPEAGPVLHRARELCERAGQPAHLFGILLGTWEWRLVRGDIPMCIDLAADGMALAERVNDQGMLMEALFMPGVTKFYRAEFADARAYYEKAIAFYDDRERTKLWAASTGHDAGVTHRCYLALALWHLGYPDQAMKVDRETRELAGAIGHAFSTAHAVDFTACLYHDCRIGAEVQRAAEEETAIATEQGFQLWEALGVLHKGAAMLLQGRIADALPLLLDGLQAFRATGAGLRIPYYLGMLGDAYTQAWRFEDAHRVFDEALATAEKNDDRFREAELHRLVGELLLAESRHHDDAAEACFGRAIDLARRQHSRAWELRATTSLARLWQRQGRGEEARGALAAVYDGYTEGFATPDLVDARVLLESLAAERALRARR